MSHEHSMNFIDLFCGIGGFHLAMSSFGHKCILACDIDKDCMQVYFDNLGLKPVNDITKINEKEMEDFDVLCGGFPCQAFSHSGKQKGFEDTRGTLFYDICRILKHKQPKYFILENVKNLKGHDKGKTWTTIHDALIDVGYNTYPQPIILSPHHIGIPQNRERVFIIGVRKDIGVLKPFPTFAKAPSCIFGILDDDQDIEQTLLDQVKMKEDEIAVVDLWDEVVSYFSKKNCNLPGFPMWSDEWDSSSIIEGLPEWKRTFILKNRNFYTDNKSFLEPWLETARRSTSFTGAKRKFEWQAGKLETSTSIWQYIFQFRPSGIRVKKRDYFPTLVAMAQIPYIGERKRKLTPRETARLQSFPESFKFHKSNNKAYKHFGNSVNVEVIKKIIAHLTM
jgi:DNA (cytosine-5)-methyltransferase 1